MFLSKDRLKCLHEFSAFQSVMASHDDNSFLFAPLKHLFIPIVGRQRRASALGGAPNPATEISILSTAIAALGNNIQIGQSVSSLFSRMFSGRRESADAAILIEAIAVAIKSSPQRHLIVLRNCHLMSEEAATLLKVLFARLEGEGWGGARFLLEYRIEGSSKRPDSPWHRPVSRTRAVSVQLMKYTAAVSGPH
jgi:hypothetical protein